MTKNYIYNIYIHVLYMYIDKVLSIKTDILYFTPNYKNI